MQETLVIWCCLILFSFIYDDEIQIVFTSGQTIHVKRHNDVLDMFLIGTRGPLRQTGLPHRLLVATRG